MWSAYYFSSFNNCWILSTNLLYLIQLILINNHPEAEDLFHADTNMTKTDGLIVLHNFRKPSQMRCTSTEYLLNFWPSYRQCSRCHFTSYHGKTAIFAVRWLAQMLWVGKVSFSNNKLKFNHSESHCGIVWLHFLLH